MNKITRCKYLELRNIIKVTVCKDGCFAHKNGAQWQSAAPAKLFVIAINKNI
jgi:hypothetical protein